MNKLLKKIAQSYMHSYSFIPKSSSMSKLLYAITKTNRLIGIKKTIRKTAQTDVIKYSIPPNRFMTEKPVTKLSLEDWYRIHGITDLSEIPNRLNRLSKLLPFIDPKKYKQKHPIYVAIKPRLMDPYSPIRNIQNKILLSAIPIDDIRRGSYKMSPAQWMEMGKRVPYQLFRTLYIPTDYNYPLPFERGKGAILPYSAWEKINRRYVNSVIKRYFAPDRSLDDFSYPPILRKERNLAHDLIVYAEAQRKRMEQPEEFYNRLAELVRRYAMWHKKFPKNATELYKHFKKYKYIRADKYDWYALHVFNYLYESKDPKVRKILDELIGSLL